MRHRFLIVSFFILSLLLPGISSGGDRSYSVILAQLQRITMEEAIERALNAIPGKVIEAEMDDGIYEIYVLSEEGWVSEVYVDPWNGSILKIKSKHRRSPEPHSRYLNAEDVRELVEKRLSNNPNLKIGDISEGSTYFKVSVLTHDDTLVDELIVDKKNEAMHSLYEE